MSINTVLFRGEIPRTAPHLLPENCAQSAINVRLLDGNLVPLNAPVTEHTFSNGPFRSIFKMESIGKWLRWTKVVDVVRSIIHGDTTNRIYFTTYGGTATGLDKPRVTNAFYATDPSQQGAAPADGYPFKSFPLGSPNPLNPPIVSTAPPVGVTTEYNFAQENCVNGVTAIPNGGTGYVVGDILNVGAGNGTVFDGLNGAQFKVESIDQATGAVTSLSVVKGGFYTQAGSPSSPSALVEAPRPNGTTGVGVNVSVTLTVVGMSFNGFNTYTEDNSAGHYIDWDLDANLGDGITRWHVDSGQGALAVANSTQSFNLANAERYVFQADMATFPVSGGGYADLVLSLAGAYNGGNAIEGPAIVLSKTDSKFQLFDSIVGTNGFPLSGTIVNEVAATPSDTTMYRIRAVCVANTSSTIPGFNVTATYALQSAPEGILGTVSGFVPYKGEFLGVGDNHRGNSSEGCNAFFENILVSVTEKPDLATLEATEYAFTYLTSRGEESGPSPVSALIDVVNNEARSVTVVLPAVPQANEQTAYGSDYITDYDITLIRLYRTLTGPSGTTFNLVVELPVTSTGTGDMLLVTDEGYAGCLLLVTDETFEGCLLLGDQDPETTYIDTMADADLGVELPSIGWDLPPADGHSIINLPNGITAIASGKQVYLSVIGQAHAYILENRLPTDTPIVAMGAIDTTLIILTEGFPYIASGTDPSNYGMAKLERAYPCMNHRSVAYLRQVGIVWASPEGLIACNGAGLRNLTQEYYAKQDWAAFKRFWSFLNPASIVASTVDDRYVGFCQELDGTVRGFIFEAK